MSGFTSVVENRRFCWLSSQTAIFYGSPSPYQPPWYFRVTRYVGETSGESRDDRAAAFKSRKSFRGRGSTYKSDVSRFFEICWISSFSREWKFQKDQNWCYIKPTVYKNLACAHIHTYTFTYIICISMVKYIQKQSQIYLGFDKICRGGFERSFTKFALPMRPDQRSFRDVVWRFPF